GFQHRFVFVDVGLCHLSISLFFGSFSFLFVFFIPSKLQTYRRKKQPKVSASTLYRTSLERAILCLGYPLQRSHGLLNKQSSCQNWQGIESPQFFPLSTAQDHIDGMLTFHYRSSLKIQCAPILIKREKTSAGGSPADFFSWPD